MTTHEFHSYYYDATKSEPVTSDFTLPAGTEMTPELLTRLIDEHRQNHLERYEFLNAAYDTHYGIFGREAKPDYKPDNRLAADMAYNITQTFEGYFIGIPLDLHVADEAKQKYLTSYIARNHQEDVDAELSKMASKFGHSYEMFYQDEEGKPRSVAISPMTSFMVYDDTVLKRPMYFVRYVYDEQSELKGSFSDAHSIHHFSTESGTIAIGDTPDPHSFGAVPAIEFMQNSEKRGLYEGVLNLIEAYNRVISEKANDVDYFSDAYLVVTGTELPDDFKKDLREYKLINLFGQEASGITVRFLAKPNGDSEQENLINRLEMLIFKMAMVPDITDESFSTASGTALKMRLMPMNNLARNKERKFVMGVQRRLELLANYPIEPFAGEDWQEVEIVMHRNMPEDLAAEAQVAGALSGIVSEETQLSVLSCVDDPKKERERKEAERNAKATSVTDGMPTNRTASAGKREAAMHEITKDPSGDKDSEEAV